MPPAATLPGQTIRQKAKASAAKTGRGNRDVVKPVLANPFTVPWPSLPNHLQVAVMAALPQIIPPEISAYHVSRARCSRAAKRARKDAEKGELADAAEAPATAPAPPARPALLDELVFGLTETIKALEKGISDLRLNMMLMSDALEGKPAAPPAVVTSGLLPTAPTDASLAPAPSPEASPLAYVLVPHLSVSPQALIDPLPVYCATYNTLRRQHAQLAVEVRLRLPRPERFIVERPEIRLVPLGMREAEISAMIGLRRVSTFAIRNGHPHLEPLDRLLPNSVLPPPRHTVTLPFPTSSLKIHDGKQSTAAPVPAPSIQYPPLHVKAIRTTAPIDTNGRKAARLTEVRRKRIENKEKRAAARRASERRAAADIKSGGKRGGRAARLAAKKAKETAAAEVDA